MATATKSREAEIRDVDLLMGLAVKCMARLLGNF